MVLLFRVQHQDWSLASDSLMIEWWLSDRVISASKNSTHCPYNAIPYLEQESNCVLAQSVTLSGVIAARWLTSIARSLYLSTLATKKNKCTWRWYTYPSAVWHTYQSRNRRIEVLLETQPKHAYRTSPVHGRNHKHTWIPAGLRCTYTRTTSTS